MDIVQQALDYDLAIERIARLRSEAIRRYHAATSDEERQKAENEIRAYNTDERVLNGYGSDEERKAVYDKVFEIYKTMFEKKFLFLDFDGVLVTDRYLDRLTASGNPYRDEYGSLFDIHCEKLLKRIILNTGADIIVTSTWKMEMKLGGIRQMWEKRQLPGKIVGVTPDIDPIHRGIEIEAWLEAYRQQCRYAIIDDCPFTDFFREDQLSHLFRVDEQHGIDEDTARLVIDYLK